MASYPGQASAPIFYGNPTADEEFSPHYQQAQGGEYPNPPLPDDFDFTSFLHNQLTRIDELDHFQGEQGSSIPSGTSYYRKDEYGQPQHPSEDDIMVSDTNLTLQILTHR
jgi:hypothetical protein